ncbi:MAG: hypothetical protein E6R03_00140 [Hyphomicrobiaceae bacterium]|nr:MAG: hypothetical protein E6R03_00140 [Hyphomicrobiaceae bacterium]
MGDSWGYYSTKTARNVVAVDPGLNFCGVAWFMDGGTVPTRVEVVKPTRGKDLGHRMAQVAEAVGSKGANFSDHLVIEMPAFQSGATREMGWKTGDLQKLTLLVGYLCAHDWGRVTLVTPFEWKGQLPKTVVMERIKRRLGAGECLRLGIERDGWDAVGIGLYALTGKV